MIEQIRQEIEAAFANVEMPGKDLEDLVRPESLDYGNAIHLAMAVGGRPWKDLDAGFLKDWWTFRYSTPKAYLYYLPAFLLKSLEDSYGELFRSTLYRLEPDYPSICARRKDDEHEYQTSLFNEQQYKAVCSFLEFALEDWPFQAAPALYRRWNRYEHRAVTRAREFHRQMVNFQYPDSADKEINDLMQQIRSAFDAAPPPDDEICTHLYDPEAATPAVELRGTDWRFLHPDFLGIHEAALCFATDKAFRYYLPAFLLADLILPEMDDSYSDTVPVYADPVWDLTHGLVSEDVPPQEVPESRKQERDKLRLYVQGLDADLAKLCEDQLAELDREEASENEPGRFERAVQRFSHFNQQERDAIVQYLIYKSRNEHEKEKIDLALEKYWLKPIQ